MAHVSSIPVSGASHMDRSVSSASSAQFSASSSPGMTTSVVASDLASNDDILSAMDEESVSMPATPPDASHMGHVHILDSAASAGTSTINATAQPVKKPELFLSITRANRPKLVLSPTDQERFSEHIQESKKKFASDTAYLPKSTNMGLSDVDAAALLSVNPFNFARPNAQSWEDDDVDVDHGRTRAAAKPGKTVFMNAFPCIFVSNLTNSISFYQKLLGFSPIGKPASHQAVLRRGPAARPPRSSSQPYSAIPSAAEETGVRIVLRYLPAEWGELKGDGSGPPQLLIVVSNVDELFQEIVTKQQQFKPNGREYFPEVFLGKAKLIGKPQNKPWGTRELHVLDPDGNKIIFYHELN